jgi:hypothetical protein
MSLFGLVVPRWLRSFGEQEPSPQRDDSSGREGMLRGHWRFDARTGVCDWVPPRGKAT